MRRCPPPLSVTLPRPSRTTRRLVLTTFAVRFSTIRTLPGPQRNRMTPPLATARTTAREVQLRALPWPTQRAGCEGSTARASRGTEAAAATDGATSSAAQMMTRATRTVNSSLRPGGVCSLADAAAQRPLQRLGQHARRRDRDARDQHPHPVGRAPDDRRRDR